MDARQDSQQNTSTTPYFTSDHEMLRSTIRRFVDERVKPYADQWEEDGFVPRSVLEEMGSLGLFGIRYGSEYGGSELDTLATVVLAEELGRSTFGGFAITVLVHTDMASPHLHHAGNATQLQRYMPDIIAGKKITAVAMTEPDAGSDLASMRTTARRDGDYYVLNGAKTYITNGIYGDVYFVAAKTGTSGRGHHDISMFIVEKDTPGFSVAKPLKNTAGYPRIRQSCHSKTAASPPKTCWVPKTRASFPWSKTCKTSVWCLAHRRWAKPVKPLN